MTPSPGDMVPRFRGRCGVQCFYCKKGKSMAPLCTKHLSEWDKLSKNLRVEISKMCESEPDQVLVKAASDAVKTELDSLQLCNRVKSLSNIAQSIETTKTTVYQCIDAINNLPKPFKLMIKSSIFC